MPEQVRPLPSWPIDLRQRPVLCYADRGRFHGPSQARYVMGAVWCLHAYCYHGCVTINGEQVAFGPGDLTITPPYAHLEYTFAEAVNDHFSLQWAQASPPAAATALVGRYDGTPAAAAIARLEPALAWFPTDRRRSEIRLWDILGELASRQPIEAGRSDGGTQTAMHHALAFIESRLGDGIGVAEVAAASGITPTHLCRLFRARFGVGPAIYLRRRRSQRAHQLLVHGGRPIKDIAALVGLPDLQHFNKVIRRELGRSPRALSRGAAVHRLHPRSP